MLNNRFEKSRSSHRKCSIKKLFLEISQNSPEKICARVFFSKLQASDWHRCFPVNFAKFLRTVFLTEALLISFQVSFLLILDYVQFFGVKFNSTKTIIKGNKVHGHVIGQSG